MNKFLTVVIIMLVVCNIFCYYTFFRDDRSKSQDTHAEYLHYMHKLSLQTENKYEGQVFPPYASAGSDTTRIDLSKMIVKPTLVFYFSDSACPPCLESVRDNIEKEFPDYQQRTDILFMSGDLEKRLRNNFLGKKIIKIHDEKKDLFFNPQLAPVLFIIDSDMKIQHLFVTDKQTPDLTSCYLNIIKQRYFN